MNRNFRRWNSIWVGPAIALAFLLLATCPRKAVAQTNTFPATGNVGIGTTTPIRPIHVVHQSNGQAPVGIDEYAAAPDIRFRRAEGTIASPTAVTINKTIGAISAAGYGATGFTTFRGLINFGTSENWTDAAQGTFLSFFTTATGSLTTSEKLRIDPGGNVGIGLTNPTYKLHVNGSFNATSINLNGSPITSSQWATSGTTINYLAGNVGIGVSPTYRFDVSDSALNGMAGRFIQTNTSASNGLFIQTRTVGAADTALHISSNAGANELFRVRNDGNVGIGISTPTYKLHVNGSFNATSVNVNGSPLTGSQWTTSGTNINYAPAGNVGIGATTPGAKLD
ncbi:MAG TPA: hypothetical protein VGW36_03190, partial [Pyrinomonadaceae bacterium]|nr:hypothetical protein [Pyrinomonadaceae bacterium]